MVVRVALIALAMLVLLVLGGGARLEIADGTGRGGDLSATPPATSASIPPVPSPHAVAVLSAADSARQQGRQGSGCWSEPHRDGTTTTTCGDSGGTPLKATALVVTAGEPLTLDFSALGTPSAASYRVYRLDEATRPVSATGGLLIVPLPGAEVLSGELPPEQVVAIELDRPVGHYVVEVNSRHPWVETVEGFKVEVRE